MVPISSEILKKKKKLASCPSKFSEEQKFLKASSFSIKETFTLDLNCINYCTKQRKGQFPSKQRGLCELLIHVDHAGVHKKAFCDSILPEPT